MRNPEEFHADESKRIQRELACLDDTYAEDGIVRFVLKGRVEQEKQRSEHGCDDEYCSCRE